ncbi:PREDICTED: uncharacterized protein LOC104718220 [Camelina sativa]|uniref:Uncharacterized protein LOC104718220 n=1 Tax=Camelina sativa TaxID=90675 RepID=A0ABM0U0X7_CAMSA|nr:PREDICTED: uncharacterized protein LOC104718220 [Camelina sativa]
MIRFARPKPKIELVGYNLLQKCYASGTPKGKAKLKTGQPLKRNKLTIKKGGGSGGGGGGEEAGKGKGRISDENQKLYDQCINAPCPVRYLRPKDIEREAKREKLGLISKARQREIEIQKKSGYKMGVITITTEPIRIGTPGLDYISLGIFTEDELPKYKVTVEDGKRLAKEYSRVLMREHRAKRVAETNLLKLREAAVEALPEHLKKAALERDLTPFYTAPSSKPRLLPYIQNTTILRLEFTQKIEIHV